jgi:hypothetical protein
MQATRCRACGSTRGALSRVRHIEAAFRMDEVNAECVIHRLPFFASGQREPFGLSQAAEDASSVRLLLFSPATKILC